MDRHPKPTRLAAISAAWAGSISGGLAGAGLMVLTGWGWWVPIAAATGAAAGWAWERRRAALDQLRRR